MNVFAYQHGIYPRSEAVVAATRGLDRGRVNPDAVEEAFRQDLAAFVNVQQQARLDFFSDGLLRWQDIFRPLVAAATAMTPTGLVRRFDNNAFFRAPELTGSMAPISAVDGVLPDGVVPQPRVATLPSPYMFARAVRNSADRNQLMLDLARDVLRPAAKTLSEAGCQLIHLEEPWLAFFGIDPSDWQPLENALAIITEGLSAAVVLHVYFGDAGPHVDRLRHLPVDAVGVDLVETEIDSLGSDWDIGLVAGCLNGRSSVVESLEGTVALVRRVADAVNPPRLYLTSSCELEFLPRDIAQLKVARLGEAGQRLKEPAAT